MYRKWRSRGTTADRAISMADLECPCVSIIQELSMASIVGQQEELSMREAAAWWGDGGGGI